MRKAKHWLAVTVLAIAAVGVTAQPAQAVTAVRVINKMTGRCLDSNLGSVTAPICATVASQDWTRTELGGATTYAGVTDFWCLTTDGMTRVYTVECNGRGLQRWYETQYGDYYELRTVSTNLCLDSNVAGAVFVAACNGGDNQRWQR